MTALAAPARYASPIAAGVHGVHVFTGPARLSGHVDRSLAVPDRLHLYAAWSCPRSHRAAIVRAHLGLAGDVSIAYVDTLRDGRGWAFREATGPDPVNGFTLLRQAYEASSPGYTGAATVPVLWDRFAGRIITTVADEIDAGLVTGFGREAELYPSGLRDDIDERSQWIERVVTNGMGRAVYDPRSRDSLVDAFGELDGLLARRRHLLGETLTLADVRLWVRLARFDAGPNAHGAIGAKLHHYEHLWSYARRLYQLPAFRDTTRFEAFTAPFAEMPDWGG